MNRSISGGFASALAALAVAVALPGTAAAQSSAQAAPVDGTWQFGVALYAYLPSVGGNMAFPTRSGDSSVAVDADTLIDSLNFAFMGTFEAHNGRFGLISDLLYLDISGSSSQSREFTVGGRDVPATVTGDLDLGLKGLAWTIAGQYRVVSSPAFRMDVLAGARLLDMKPTLTWSLSGNVGSIPTPGRGGSLETEAKNWDGIVGVRGRFSFGDRMQWHIPFYADVGAGDSDLTWQAATGLGYAFSWGDVIAMWRYLDYEMKSGQPVADINFNGPMIGVVFRW
jgi:hypothetical protein